MLAFAQNSFVFSTCYFLSRESSGDIPCGPPVLAPLSVCANIAASTQPSGRSGTCGRAPALAGAPHRPGGHARDAFVRRANELLTAVSKEENVLFVDLEGPYRAEAEQRHLFKDHLHPNDAGHALIAETVFRALTSPRTR